MHRNLYQRTYKKFVLNYKKQVAPKCKKECSEWWVYGKKTFQSRTNLITTKKQKFYSKKLIHTTHKYFFTTHRKTNYYTHAHAHQAHAYAYTHHFSSPHFFTHIWLWYIFYVKALKMFQKHYYPHDMIVHDHSLHMGQTLMYLMHFSNLVQKVLLYPD